MPHCFFSNLIYFFKNAVDKALYKANTAILVGTSTWLEQFKQAFSVKGIPTTEMFKLFMISLFLR
jgi:hypothetical protein